MATLSPTPLDHFLAVRRAHALQKAVARLSLASVWLVCSFHGGRSSWFGEAGILCPLRSIVKPLICLLCLLFNWACGSDLYPATVAWLLPNQLAA